ncbi:rhamnulokinase [Mediterraneibacter glycyrrhizinilyticus]|uniref:rhamnulokinase n=1 Tax=Mediterraneibacter glycyrrhizinilyticus TaxID=342942 RepID=UPI0025A4C7CA|nr:rhamnulokinase [Mediterraneibacter glycyrrhizinilyticus]MDM8210476.1 rhamnulokinase [Mediterraneibacter glycyrrhizinilyticus]
MEKYYLAVDIGASSGRHMLASMKDGKMQLEEVYRFPNGMDNKNGTLCWDVERLITEIKNGLKKCKEIGKIPVSMGIDTWGVDYVLLDKDDNILGDTAGYRDSRTEGMDEKVYEVIPQDDLYARTGIQKQIFNTIYQLMAVKQSHPEYLEQAETILMIPDYFNFLLTGVKKNEYTEATTGQLISPKTNDWDYELIDMLGYNSRMFLPVSMPGTVVGDFTEEVQKEVGFNCTVVLPATHDTGSAVLAVPTNDDDAVYISSGTWSLMGIERKEADCSMESMKANFTNEGGYDHRFRYLKNIMGLWMIQSVKKEFTEDLSFAEICEMASKETISSIVDCNDDCFLAPKSMIEAVQKFCRDTDQQVPETVGEISSVIYNSLAKCYGDTVEEIEAITGKKYSTIYVVGGGSNAGYLNELTAKYTGRKVSAGPSEATAIGNIIVQMLHDGVFASLPEARTCVKESFDVKMYE